MEKINSNKALSSMRNIESSLVLFSSQFDIAIMNGWEGQKIKAVNDIVRVKNKAIEIYKEFKDGCKVEVEDKYLTKCCGTDRNMCIHRDLFFCDNCKEIESIYNDAILGARE